jgi:hypothetical protein
MELSVEEHMVLFSAGDIETGFGSLYARRQIAKRDVDIQALCNEVQRHVIRIIEDYEDNEVFFIVMELVADGNLHQYLEKTISDRTQQALPHPPCRLLVGPRLGNGATLCSVPRMHQLTAYQIGLHSGKSSSIIRYRSLYN